MARVAVAGRGLDLGTVRVQLEADAPRVNCPVHGPTVVAVPWARHGADGALSDPLRAAVVGTGLRELKQ